MKKIKKRSDIDENERDRLSLTSRLDLAKSWLPNIIWVVLPLDLAGTRGTGIA